MMKEARVVLIALEMLLMIFLTRLKGGLDNPSAPECITLRASVPAAFLVVPTGCHPWRMYGTGN
jgi:hypothetical protein